MAGSWQVAGDLRVIRDERQFLIPKATHHMQVTISLEIHIKCSPSSSYLCVGLPETSFLYFGIY